MSLPVTGASNWGVPLNNYIINVVLAAANTANSAISNHQTASDPHGDRAYALSLVAPLTTGVNGPNGFLQLNSIGKIPNGVLPPGGGRTSSFDVVKDYSAPTNGTDATTQIQNALNDCGTAGGGEVWVGDGTYGISLPLYVPSNVWLHLSPGAVMNRIVNGGSGLAPAYMVANFNGSTSATGSGNIIVEGGSWVFDSQTATGVPMAFVSGSNVTVKDTSIRTLAQGAGVLFAGFTNGEVDGVTFLASAPGGARSTYTSSPPAVRVESAVSSTISGLNAAMYTGNPCSTVYVEDCYISGNTSSDGTGLYTVFGGMAGTTNAQASSFHTNVFVRGCTAVALPANGTYPANWQSCTVTSNQFNLNNGQVFTATWNPSAPGTTNQVVANNTTTTATGNLNTYYTANSSGRTGTTLSLDGTLQATVQANAVYEVRAAIGYSSGNSDFKYDFSLPSGSMNYNATKVEAVYNGFSGNFYPALISSNVAGTFDTASVNGGAVTILGLLQVGATGGTFGFEWCQKTNQPGYPIVLLAGSYLILNRVA